MIQLEHKNDTIIMELKFNQLNKRQEIILNLIDKQGKISVSELVFDLVQKFSKISRITIIRDLNQLLKFNFVKRIGKGRSVVYQLSNQYNLLKPIDVNDYFKIAPDQRRGKKSFNFELVDIFKNIFIVDEEKELNQLAFEYQKNIKKLPKANFKREFERLVIELSWKSSAIEGNTYTLLETEFLIKHNKQAKGRKKKEAIMILNHKNVLEYIRKNLLAFKKITVAKLEDIHFLLTKDLDISSGLRKLPVGITGTAYCPIDNVFQIREALEKTCAIVNQEKNIFAKAVILMVMVAYIQPFDDGNKRTSRLAANAILMANNICPLSYRSVKEEEYKKAIILFYEQNNISYFKNLFIEQFEFAVKNYFVSNL
ncbi:Fic family protein [Candidatus Parcubacteria bacterium]|nr:Fic family protein [Candidatus Parcubacteria bacterium]